jgi:3-oxoacyl-[acyl-carrier protein] reductase
MSKRFTGKTVVVTGASKGIGAEIARYFGREGASVVVNYATSRVGAEKVVAEIKKAGGAAINVQGDMRKTDDVRRLFAETKKNFGGLDVLVNNAGVYEFAALEEITPEHFHKMFDLNVLGVALATQEAAKLMAEKGGSIINISSVAATSAFPTTSIYSATKAAVDVLTRSLAKELGPRKIRVNSVNPGMIETEGTKTSGISDGEFRAQVEAQTPLGRIGQPDDIAPVVGFLASDEARWITGETLYVSGGQR